MKLLHHLRIGCEERTLLLLERLANLRNPTALPAHLVTGLQGEDAAFFHLRRRGYTVVARRWSAATEPGDIDLIAWKDGVLCFVEVKTRTAHDLKAAEAAIDEHKRRVLRRLARSYIRHLPQAEWPPARFDVISVYLLPWRKPEITHFEGSFWLNEHACNA